MNEPGTGKKILAVVAGSIILALTAALVFLLLEMTFDASRPRTGDKDEKYRLFSARVAWSFYIALFTGAFTGAMTTLLIVKARLLKLACITALTPLAIITLSLVFDKEGGRPDMNLLPMVACLLGGAAAAWYVKRYGRPNDQ